MKRRKFLLGSSALFASGAFATGTGAFSSAEVERGVQVSVAGDKNAYLALTTDEDGDPTVGLHGAEGPFEAPKTITVANQLTESLTVTIESDDAITLDGKEHDGIQFELSQPGDMREVKINLDTFQQLEAELDIHAEGTDVEIEATRTLVLEPKEAEVELANINTVIHIENIGNVDNSSVVVLANGNTFGTVQNGNNIKIDYDDPGELGCGPSDDKIMITVEGKTTGGTPFSGSTAADSVNCAASGNNNQGDGNGNGNGGGNGNGNGNQSDNGVGN